jgi:hypothetical protein
MAGYSLFESQIVRFAQGKRIPLGGK